MKKTTRTIELTVERSEFFIRRSQRTVSAWCAECGGQVAVAAPEEAARATGTSARTIYRRIEAGTIHFMETPEGCLLVCLVSLS